MRIVDSWELVVSPIGSARAERHENGPDSIMAWLPTGVRIEDQFIIRLLRQLVKDAHRLTDGFRVRLDLLSPLPLGCSSLNPNHLYGCILACSVFMRRTLASVRSQLGRSMPCEQPKYP